MACLGIGCCGVDAYGRRMTPMEEYELGPFLKCVRFGIFPWRWLMTIVLVALMTFQVTVFTQTHGYEQRALGMNFGNDLLPLTAFNLSGDPAEYPVPRVQLFSPAMIAGTLESVVGSYLNLSLTAVQPTGVGQGGGPSAAGSCFRGVYDGRVASGSVERYVDYEEFVVSQAGWTRALPWTRAMAVETWDVTSVATAFPPSYRALDAARRQRYWAAVQQFTYELPMTTVDPLPEESLFETHACFRWLARVLLVHESGSGVAQLRIDASMVSECDTDASTETAVDRFHLGFLWAIVAITVILEATTLWETIRAMRVVSRILTLQHQQGSGSSSGSAGGGGGSTPALSMPRGPSNSCSALCDYIFDDAGGAGDGDDAASRDSRSGSTASRGRAVDRGLVRFSAVAAFLRPTPAAPPGSSSSTLVDDATSARRSTVATVGSGAAGSATGATGGKAGVHMSVVHGMKPHEHAGEVGGGEAAGAEGDADKNRELGCFDILSLFRPWVFVATIGNVFGLIFALTKIFGGQALAGGPLPRVILGFSAACLWLSLLQFTEYDQRLNVAALTMSRAVGRIGAMLVGLLPVYVALVFLGMSVFCSVVPRFNDPLNTAVEVFAYLNGDAVRETITRLVSAAGPGRMVFVTVLGQIYCFLCMLFLNYVGIHCIIPVVEEAFFSVRPEGGIDVSGRPLPIMLRSLLDRISKESVARRREKTRAHARSINTAAP